MARPLVQLSVHQAHLASQNAAIVQTCVPFVSLKGESYRLKNHDLGTRPPRQNPDTA